MIEFGATLRQAREAKGLTLGQIAEQTHLMIQTVEALENENFSKIAAPIYGRGFVRLYCEAVGLDPKVLIPEFMDIFNGNRPPTIRMRAPEPPPPQPIEEAPVTPEPPPANDKTPVIEDSIPPAAPADLFHFEQESAPAPVSVAPRATPANEPAVPAFVSTGPSRYSAPMPIDSREEGKSLLSFLADVPSSVWRILILAISAGLILWLLFAGARGLYRATMTPAKKTAVTEEKQAAPTPVKSEATDAKRQPLSIPPLYID